MKLNKTDIGCHADATYGHDHVRRVLADLVTSYCNDPELVRALNAPMSDDASEEDDAIDALNFKGCEDGVYFTFLDGDLMLRSIEDDCPDCGAHDGHHRNCPANL